MKKGTKEWNQLTGFGAFVCVSRAIGPCTIVYENQTSKRPKLFPSNTLTMSSVSSRSEIGSRSDISTSHSTETAPPEEGSDTGSVVEFHPPTETVREVYLISDEDAREHEDAVELVNWSTFEEWKRPWHVVQLWEGSVYDEMTLWGSIPLQNDKLRKVSL